MRRFLLGLLTEVFDGASEKAAGAASGVHDGFAELRIDLVDDELGDGSGRVKFARITVEDGFVVHEGSKAAHGGCEVSHEFRDAAAREVACCWTRD